MAEKSILFFDIDGTLISDDASRYLPDSAKEAIRLARQAGHLTFINTGRVMLNVDDFIRDVGFDGYVCGCGTYIEYQGEVLLHHTLNQKLCHDTAKLLYDCGLFGLYEAHDANGYDDRLVSRYQDNEAASGLIAYFASAGKEFMTDITASDFHFDKFSAWFDQDCDMERFKNGIAEYFTYIDRGADFCEVVPRSFSKATGIQYLMDYFSIPWERTFAFGDSQNDLPMLDFVKHSVVMGGADDSLKQMASYITDGVEADGLYHAIKHFGLLSDEIRR